ncbi:hypothetical protein Mgra_00003070, partial [Meloidogyne graminicola]
RLLRTQDIIEITIGKPADPPERLNFNPIFLHNFSQYNNAAIQLPCTSGDLLHIELSSTMEERKENTFLGAAQTIGLKFKPENKEYFKSPHPSFRFKPIFH